MTEHAWLAVLSALITIAIFLLSVLLASMRNWKKEIIGKIDKVEANFETKAQRICEENRADHVEIWERVNHHGHNGGGSVVIPTPGLTKG